MKCKACIKAICRHCKLKKRGKINFIRCPYNKNHNQRQGWPKKVPRSQYSTLAGPIDSESYEITSYFSSSISRTIWIQSLQNIWVNLKVHVKPYL